AASPPVTTRAKAPTSALSASLQLCCGCPLSTKPSKTLNAQEKRNAQFSGEFKQFILSESTERLGLWRNLSIFSDNDIARMVEVQFMSDVVYNLINCLSDFRPSALDSIYKRYDEDFDKYEAIGKRLEY